LNLRLLRAEGSIPFNAFALLGLRRYGTSARTDRRWWLHSVAVGERPESSDRTTDFALVGYARV